MGRRPLSRPKPNHQDKEQKTIVKRNCDLPAVIWNRRRPLGFAICSTGALIALSSLADAPGDLRGVRAAGQSEIAAPSASATPNPNCLNDPFCPTWVARYNGAGGYDRGIGIVASPDGTRIYVTGQSTGGSSGLDFATIAYDAASGQQLWLARYNGPANANDSPFAFGTGKAIAVSPDGTKVFVTGTSTNSNGIGSYITIAYNAADGSPAWVSNYSTPQDSNATSLAISGDGQRLYVTGFSALVLTTGGAADYDFATVGYDTVTGNELWVARYQGPGAFWDIPYSAGVASVAQPDGSHREQVFVTGRSNGTSTGADFATIAYDGLTGSQLWVTRYDGPGHGDDYAYGLTVSPDGSAVFVTGPTVGLTGTDDYTTLCYDTVTGTQRWVSRYDNGDLDESIGAAVSPSGDKVAVTGFSVNPIGGIGFTPIRDAATILYDAVSGNQLWVGRHAETDGAATSVVRFSHDGRRLYVAGLENGNVVGVGNNGVGVQAGHSPSLTVAYDAASGRELWATHYLGPAGDEGNSDLAVSPDDTYVFVTGGGQSSAADISTLAYATGALPQLTSRWISPLGLTPTPRSDAAMTYDAARQQILLFGGAVGGGGLAGLNNETWLLNSGNWVQAGPQNFPYGRVNAGIAYDEIRQQVVLFGGYTASTIQFGDTNDTWTWNGDSWSQIAASATPGNTPAAREAPAMAYFRDSNLTILFGGISVTTNQSTVQGDTWSWNGSAWTQITPAASPPARYAAAMVYDAARHQLVLFGGSGLNDTWTWDGTNWTQANPATRPPARSYAGATYDIDHAVVLLYGGVDASGKPLDDTWTWDGVNWAQQLPLHTPGARGDAVITYDPNQHRAFLFGGSNATDAFGDTWAWDGSDWQSLGEATQPMPRIAAPMTYDPRHHKTILFGGLPSAGIFNDTWQWDGATWKQLQPPAAPPARGYTSMIDNPALGRVVLFGGFGLGVVLSDTWSWDGSTWTQEQPAHSPPARTSPQLAYDGSHVLLYGGFDGHGNVYGDTWEWDGNDWTQLSPATSPPPLNAGAMTYDPVHRQVVLFGGSTGPASGVPLPANVDAPIAETWTWDGTNWTQQNPAHSPPAITGHSMIYDAELGGVVLLDGGQSAARSDVLGPKGLFNNQLWLWNGIDWIQVVTTVVPGPRGFESLAYDSDRRALVLYGGNGAHGVQGDTWTFAPPPVQPTGIVSRKVHGSAGQFDINLALTGNPSIECRSGGMTGNHTLVFTFAVPLTNVAGVSANATGGGAAPDAAGMIDSTDAHHYVVNLGNVPNAQYTTVSLTNVSDSLGNFSSNLQTTMGVLLGDVNGDGQVDSGDLIKVKQQTLQPVNDNPGTSNFRADVNTDANIDSGDLIITKRQTLTGLPIAP
jgi:WD40 repeat protein